ncbi:MAG: manganese efflux pump [Acidobacteria bacterium]|nr:MAG: manganese efflux pump [Acidobacteriota bacterium]RLE24155.1 MAG: manganese efflux pump [Acidobacteriota bacterium]
MPHFLSLLGISLSLAMDALAVSISTAVFLGDVSKRQGFRIYFHFGLFQALYPVIGWLAGHTISAHLLKWNKAIAFILLLGVGIKMIWDAIAEGEETQRKDPTRGILLLALSTSVSIDALAVGVSFSLLGMTIVLPAVIIGVVTGIISYLGIQFGKILGQGFGQKMSIAGGLVLIAIALKILLF